MDLEISTLEIMNFSMLKMNYISTLKLEIQTLKLKVPKVWVELQTLKLQFPAYLNVGNFKIKIGYPTLKFVFNKAVRSH